MTENHDNCVLCLRAGRVNPRCALCQREFNFGEEFGGQWCSQQCLDWSWVLQRNPWTGRLELHSQSRWERFYQDYYKRWGEPVPEFKW